MDWSSQLRRSYIVREPLLHFLLIGLALFLYYGHVARAEPDARRIVVSQAQVEDLVRQYQATWNELPTPRQLTTLVDAYVYDEILYREGRALGLDRDDTMIKRRVRQKLEIISEENISHDAPSDAQLSAYLQLHADAFRQPAVVSFEQIYFTQTGSAADLQRRIESARGSLERGADPAALGQPTMLPAHLEQTPLDLVVRDFGEPFARQLLSVPLGRWSGPLPSAFGSHLVRVSFLKPPELPPFTSVRPLVARAWEEDRRRLALDDDYRRLRRQYDVVIDASLPAAAVR